MRQTDRLPELLAPAGSYEALRAALAAGADAVYFGSTAFSNRMRARNFGEGEITDSIKLCHSCGARAHITVNTRVRDSEKESLCALLETILGNSDRDANADAIICADFGVARYIKKNYPHAVLHASTQTSLSSVSDCEELKKLGFDRIVFPRELSYGEIKSITAAAPIETEIFVHGAHCVSLSGQCLLSAMIGGGRSGNRGECAQPCRLPYSLIPEGSAKTISREVLSLADMCLAGDITKVIDSGADSLKLEGRMKPAAYVYGVTKIYRRLLDERRDADAGEIKELKELFSRGFTDGYFAHRYHAGMTCVKVGDKAETELDPAAVRKGIGERTAKENERRKSAGEEITAKLTVKRGEKSALRVSLKSANVSRETSAEVYGDIPSEAEGGSLTKALAYRSLSKLGGTGFTLAENDLETEIEEGLWLSSASLNALRRSAAEALSGAVSASSTEDKNKINIYPDKITSNAVCTARERTCELTDASSLADKSAEDFAEYARVYVDFVHLPDAVRLLGAEKACLVLPALTPDDGAVRRILTDAKALGVNRAMVHTIGQAALCREADIIYDMSYRANIWSSDSLDVYLSLGCATVCVSPELSAGEIAEFAENPRVTYLSGRIIPVMHLSRCAICEGKYAGRCPNRMYGGRLSADEYDRCGERKCRMELTDRMGMKLEVLAQPDCTNIIYAERRNAPDGGHEVR